MTLYVWNIEYTLMDDALRELFEPFGEVLCAEIIKDRQTGRSRGFGFMEMPNAQAAQAAINALHGCSQLGGRTVFVQPARSSGKAA